MIANLIDVLMLLGAVLLIAWIGAVMLDDIQNHWRDDGEDD